LKKNDPKVSIGLPVYNGQNYLQEAVESLLNQNYNNIEIIISDNASTDRTEKICKHYAEGDDRIKYFRQSQNRGAAFNYNFVFKKSDGKYFKWAAHDDICMPDFVKECVSVLENYPGVVLCYPKIVNINEFGNRINTICRNKGISEIPHKRLRDIISKNYTCEEIFGLIRADILKKTSLIKSYTDSDRTLLGELCLHGRFQVVDSELLCHRDHDEMSTKAYQNFFERASWFDPNLEGKFVYSYLKQIRSYLSAILRSKFELKEKWFCLIEVIKWVKWNFYWIKREIKFGIFNKHGKL